MDIGHLIKPAVTKNDVIFRPKILLTNLTTGDILKIMTKQQHICAVDIAWGRVE